MGKSKAESAKNLTDRRSLLRGITAGVAGLGIARADETVGANAPDWMKTPGRSFTAYGVPAKWEEKVQRGFTAAPGRAGTGISRTPLHLMEGTITPNGLHFERHHNGVPDIDPSKHELAIHGLVKRQLAFSVETLKRYPMESHIYFIECPGNGGAYNAPQPAQQPVHDPQLVDGKIDAKEIALFAAE